MEPHSCDTKGPVSIISFWPKFKLPCGTNCTHEAATMWVRLSYINARMDNVLNSRMCSEDKSTLITASIRANDAKSRKRFQSYLETDNNIIKKLTTKQAIAELDMAIVHCVQPSIMTQQYAEDAVPKSCKVSDVYD